MAALATVGGVTSHMPAQRFVYGDSSKLISETARYWADSARADIAARGAFHVALSGGGTPRQLFRYLAAHHELNIDWGKTHIYFGDERCVGPEHPDSNFRMAQQALLAAIAIPASQVHRIEGERDPADAARRYAHALEQTVPHTQSGLPCFDLVLLGIGTDGHTASLFPHTAAINEHTRTVVENQVEKLKAWRITITFPVINAARRVLLLAEGASKTEIFAAITAEGASTAQYPILHVAPQGDYRWHLDHAAASKLQ